jgi:hypothetical protein
LFVLIIKDKMIFQGSVAPKSFSLPESGQVAGRKEAIIPAQAGIQGQKITGLSGQAG